MSELLFKLFAPATYVTVGKVNALLNSGKLIEEQKDFVKIQKDTGEIATVDKYGRVTWE